MERFYGNLDYTNDPLLSEEYAGDDYFVKYATPGKLVVPEHREKSNKFERQYSGDLSILDKFFK